MSPEQPRPRTNYLPDRPYQLRFVTRLFVVVFIVAVVSSSVSSWLLWQRLYLPNHEPSPVFIASLIAVAATLLIELLLAIPLIVFLGVRQSHRIVGPMNRLRETLEAIGRGDFSRRVTVRPGDALEDLAEAVNQMAESLQRRSTK